MRISDWSSDVCSSDLPWIDAPISFARIQVAEATGTARGISKAEGKAEQAEEGVNETTPGWEHREAGYRLSRLEAAKKLVASVAPEEDISAALTKLMLTASSQLHVMNGRDGGGVVTRSERCSVGKVSFVI